MCKLWTTELSKSLTPFYFVIGEHDSSIDTISEALVDIGYSDPPSISSAETEASQLNKGFNAILLCGFNVDEDSYIAGVATPIIPNVSKLRRNRMIEAITGVSFIIYIGIILGIWLAGMGVRGEPRPYLLEWLSQNAITLSVIGLVLFIVPFTLCIDFLHLNLQEINYETAAKVHSDLNGILNRLCSNLETDTITIALNPRTVEEKENAILPEVVREPLESLVSMVNGLNKIDGTILDIALKPIRPDVTRTY